MDPQFVPKSLIRPFSHRSNAANRLGFANLVHLKHLDHVSYDLKKNHSIGRLSGSTLIFERMNIFVIAMQRRLSIRSKFMPRSEPSYLKQGIQTILYAID